MRTYCKNNATGKSKTIYSVLDDNIHKSVMMNIFSEYKTHKDVQDFENKTGYVLEYIYIK